MSFASLVQRTWNRNLLFSVLVELTYRCNLDCFFCYNDLELKGEPLSREQYFRLFDDLREMEVLNLILSGGEPLAHPDFFALGARARELGFVVRIKSNGHALGGAMARRVKEEIDPFLVEVSLHGAVAATHDRQTRVPGSFERLLGNLGEMLELGLRVKINSTLTAWNEDEIEGIMDIADDFGVRLQIDPEVTPRDDGDASPLSIKASREGLERFFRLLAERRAPRGGSGDGATGPAVQVGRQADDGLPAAESSKHCGAGSSTVAVDPYGNVYPCVQWRRGVGNLHRQSIREIWKGSADLEEIREINTEVRRTVDGFGVEGRMMGFCPGVALMRTGSPTEVHEQSRERLELVRAVRAARAAGTPLPVIR